MPKAVSMLTPEAKALLELLHSTNNVLVKEK